MHGLTARYLLKSLFFLGALAGGALFFPLFTLFMTNPQFNGAIFFVWFLAVLLIFLGFFQLLREEGVFYKKSVKNTKLLAPLFDLHQRTGIANSAMIDQALSRAKNYWQYDTIRYLSGSLIFIGLIGTLWGLSETVLQIAEVISNLQNQGVSEGFFEVVNQLRKPLAGMGVAFSSSLFGVAGSVTLGFLLLQLDQAKESFFHKAESWAPTLFKMMEAPSLHSAQDPDFLQNILEQWLLGVERLGRLNYTNEKRKEDLMAVVLSFGEKTHTLSELMRVQNLLLNKWAEEQLQTRQSFERLGQKMTEMSFSGEAMIEKITQLVVLCQQGLRLLSHEATENARMDLKKNRPFDPKR